MRKCAVVKQNSRFCICAGLQKSFDFRKKCEKTVKKCVLALIKAPPKTVKLVKWNRIYKAAISHSGLGPECDIAAL